MVARQMMISIVSFRRAFENALTFASKRKLPASLFGDGLARQPIVRLLQRFRKRQ